MARPTLSGERKTDRTLRIRLTDAERDALDSAARWYGEPTSRWAREELLRLAGVLHRVRESREKKS
jgi:uncharacterized protein (DUF1778 family)